MKCYEKFEEGIGNAFAKYGKFISRHPKKIIVGVILLNGLLGIGMLRIEVDIDVNRVYTPVNSQATKDEKKVKAIFPDKSGESFYGYQLTITALSARILFQPNNGTILNIAFLDKVQELVDKINETVAIDKGTPIRLSDICARNNGRCVIDGDIFLSSEFRQAVKFSNVTYPDFFRSTGEPVDLVPLLAGSSINDTVIPNILTEATRMSLQFNLRSDTDDFVTKSKAWQERFLDVMGTFHSGEFDFAYAHSDSLSEELNANINGDIGLFSVTFTLMITYACIATYSASNDCVGNRMFLGFAGVLAAGLGIVASFGLVSACGMKFVSIVGNAPFLILGIGVDAMFILLSGLADANFNDNTGDRIGQMMKTSGVAITITSFTDILAFAAGATSTFVSVRNFCVFTGVAVVFTYINQMTLFTACVAANEDRIEQGRHFIFCTKTTSRKDLRSKKATRSKIFCCGGRKPDKREDVESYFERFPRIYLPKVVLPLPVKIIILILFAGYLGVSIWGIIGLKQGLVIRNLVSEDSYFLKYTQWSEDYFEARVPISFVIDSTVTYSATKTQTDVQGILDRAQRNKFISAGSQISWLSEYKLSPYYNDSSENAFIQSLQNHFFIDPRYARFRHDVVISSSGDAIIASRVYVFTITIVDSQDNGKLMLDMRDIAAETPPPLTVTAFSPPFIIFEQYVAILPQTLQTLGASIGAVFLITAIFMPHPLLLVYVIGTMAMIIAGIIGFMHHWDLTLSSITMIHLIMSVGFSVDFTAHICHAFMVANGKNRNERVKVALQTSGGPILNGAISSVLGIVMLSIAKSYIFKSFFQVMLLVVVFGVGHAVLFLPAVLSFIGPAKSDNRNAENNDSSAKDHQNKGTNKVSPTTSRQNSANVELEKSVNGDTQGRTTSGYHGYSSGYDRNSIVHSRTQSQTSVKDEIAEKLSSPKNVTVLYTGNSLKIIDS